MVKQVLSEAAASRYFARLVSVAEACATEGIFPVETGGVDCDLCPCRESCLKYWDESVVSLPLSSRSISRYVNEVTWRLEDFKKGNLKGSRRRRLLLRLVETLVRAISRKRSEEAICRGSVRRRHRRIGN